ncbi:MAG: hypothetical protein H6Q84_2590 [Deltaproteobacteria bacterium]|nr:hypothetical protein [Deltaproteobacteria bacterium]
MEDPSAAVRRWRILTGRKVVGCPPRFPVPELFHSVGMLPVLVWNEEERKSLVSLVDEWAVIQEPFPEGLEGALDWVESIAELAEALSGEPCTEGAVDRSLRAYRQRDALAERLRGHCAAFPGFLDPGTLHGVIDSGRFLPVETHAILMERILGEEAPAGHAPEADGGDPFLLLARRTRDEMDKAVR